MTITCSQLLEKHSQAWKQATVHPFLTQCQLGNNTTKAIFNLVGAGIICLWLNLLGLSHEF